MANDDEPEGGILYNIGGILLVFFLSILGSLLAAWCMGRIYDWFLLRDLGPGPSMAGWFGISELVHLVMAVPLVNVERKERTSGISTSIGLIIGLTLITLFITIGAYLTGLVVGWI